MIAALAPGTEEVTAIWLGLVTSFDKELLCKDLVDIDLARDNPGRLVQLVDFLEGRRFDPKEPVLCGCAPIDKGDRDLGRCLFVRQDRLSAL